MEFHVKPGEPVVKTIVYMPRAVSEMLDELSLERGIPKSRLVCYAIDNEFDQVNPFYYPCEYPDQPYVELAFAQEAHWLIDFMRKKFLFGTGRDMLMLCRREMNIPDRMVFMLAYREAIKQKLIREEKPSKRIRFKGFLDDYKVTKLINIPRLFKPHGKKVYHEEDLSDVPERFGEIPDETGSDGPGLRGTPRRKPPGIGPLADWSEISPADHGEINSILREEPEDDE